MSKLIKQIHDLILLATDKGLTAYWSDSQIDDGIHKAQMGFYRELIGEFSKTKKVRNELLPFQKKASITITAKFGSLPADYQHERDCWVTSDGKDWPVTILEDGAFRNRLNDTIVNPTTDFTNLIANISFDTSNKIELSAQITPLVFRYFIAPIKPVYATTISSGTPVYDDAGSTDVKWTDETHDVIVDRSLLIFGLSMRDQQLQRVGSQSIPSEQSAL